MIHEMRSSARRILRIASAGDGAHDEKRLFSGCDFFRQGSIWRFVGQILLAREEAHEGAALLRNLIAQGAAKRGMLRFKRIEHGALRGLPFHHKVYIAI